MASKKVKDKDTRTVTCYVKDCPDYRRERPITEKCGCQKKVRVVGAGR